MDWHRVISLLVAAVLLTALGWTGGTANILRGCAAVALPMACIWFPREMGNLTGARFGLVSPMVTEPSPPEAVRLVGWLLLVAIAVAVLYVLWPRG